MEINVVQWYAHLGVNLVHIAYTALRANLKGTLQVCDGCSSFKVKACTVMKKTYTRA